MNNDPKCKVLDNNEKRKLKIIFFGVDKNIIATGLSELIGWEDMFNNDDDNENINNEKILPDDDILKNDYSFKEEEELDEVIYVDKDSDNSDNFKENYNNINILILNILI